MCRYLTHRYGNRFRPMASSDVPESGTGLDELGLTTGYDLKLAKISRIDKFSFEAGYM